MVPMLDEHLGYIADAIRRERFATAISKVIKGTEQVVDLGCGSGILGLLCLKAGAVKVYAIDSTAMIEVARQTMARAGLADRCDFIHELSTRAALPSRVDVVVCDQVGYFGFDAGVVGYLADARRRFVKPSGITIPRRIDLLLAPIQSDKCAALSDTWRSDRTPAEFHWVSDLSVNAKHAVNFAPDELLGQPTALGTIELGLEQGEYFEWSAALHIDKAGWMHGVGGWFNCELVDGVWMTNSPLAPDRIQRSQAFLPLRQPLQLTPGDVVEASILARPADNMLAWHVRLRGTEAWQVQSTFLGGLISPSELAFRDPLHLPNLRPYGRAKSTVLALCDGTHTVMQIEQLILERHPDVFAGEVEACRFVAGVLGKDAA